MATDGNLLLQTVKFAMSMEVLAASRFPMLIVFDSLKAAFQWQIAHSAAKLN
jgi:hypothetical protein